MVLLRLPKRQRLILQGCNLDDADELDSALDLELVVLSFASPSTTQVEELIASARNGSVQEAPVSKKLCSQVI